MDWLYCLLRIGTYFLFDSKGFHNGGVSLTTGGSHE